MFEFRNKIGDYNFLIILVQKECCLTSDEEDNDASTELSSKTISKYTNFFRYFSDKLIWDNFFSLKRNNWRLPYQ